MLKCDTSGGDDPVEAVLQEYIRKRGFIMPPATSPKKADRGYLKPDVGSLGDENGSFCRLGSRRVPVEQKSIKQLLTAILGWSANCPDQRRSWLLASITASLLYLNEQERAKEFWSYVIQNGDLDENLELRKAKAEELTFTKLKAMKIGKVFLTQSECDDLFSNVQSEGARLVLQLALSRSAVLKSDHSLTLHAADPGTSTPMITSPSTSTEFNREFTVLRLSGSVTRLSSGCLDGTNQRFAIGHKCGLIVLGTTFPSGVNIHRKNDAEKVMSTFARAVRRVCLKVNEPDVSLLYGQSSLITSLSFVGNDHLLSSAYDGTIKLFDLQNSVPLVNYYGHHSNVWNLSVDTHGSSRFATASFDGVVRIFDFSQVMPLRILPGHTDSCDRVAFSPECDGGSMLASASCDGTVKVWDIRSPLCVGSYSIPKLVAGSCVLTENSVICSVGKDLFSFCRRTGSTVTLSSTLYGDMTCLHLVGDEIVFADCTGRIFIESVKDLALGEKNCAYYAAGLSTFDISLSSPVVVLGHSVRLK